MLRVAYSALTAILFALLAFPALAQENGVIVLGEEDFDKVPDSVRGQSLGRTGLPSVQHGSGTAEILDFDPRRDARRDIEFAIQTAAREGKHVLLEIGGDWCPYCKLLDRFFDANPEITALRRQNFVYVKVNFSQENQNQAALSPYPPVRSFPHFLVLNSKGTLARSQRIAHLGTQQGYSPAKFRQFFNAYPAKAAPGTE